MVTGAVAIAIYVMTQTEFSKDTKEILRALIGTFTGAALAFFSHRWHQQKKKIHEDRAALFLTFFILRAQFDDFLQFRSILFRTIVGMHNEYVRGPLPPLWAYIKPFRYTFNPANVFAPESLVFLLEEKEGRSAFIQLQFVERTYLELINAHADMHECAQDVQKKLSEGPHEAPWDVQERHLGPALAAKARDVLFSALLRADKDEGRFTEALMKLNTAGHKIFSKGFSEFEIEIMAPLKKENLPVLPDRIRTHLGNLNAANNLDAA